MSWSEGWRSTSVVGVVAVVLVTAPIWRARAQESSGESGVEVIEHAEESESDEEEASSEENDESAGGEAESGVETIHHSEESEESEKSQESAGGDESEKGDEESVETGAESDDASSAGSSAFSARYGTGLWVDTQWEGGREDIVEWRGNVGLELEQDLSVNWSAVASGEFRYWMGARQELKAKRAAAEVRLEESYVLYQSNHWAFRAGHLRTPWGSTSLIRPGDVVNSVDATGFAAPTDAGGRLLPQPTVEVSHIRPNWSLTGLVVPFFVPNRVTLFGRDSAVATGRDGVIGRQYPVADVFRRLLDRSVYEEAQPLLASPSRPDERPENASLGLRWTGTRWNTDFGLGYFWGWDRTPSIEIDEDVRELAKLAAEDGQVLRDFDIQAFVGREPDALDLFDSIAEKRRMGETLVDIEHERLHSVVADVSRYFGPIGVRGDVAFHPERTYVTQGLRTVRRPTIFAAAGASYERFVDDRPFVATLEGFWLEPLDADAALTRWFVAEGERGSESSQILLLGDRYRGVSGAVDWALPVADLELRLGSLVELDTGGVIADARFSRRWASWFRASLGATFYEGTDPSEELSVGGLYDRNDRVGIRVDGSF